MAQIQRQTVLVRVPGQADLPGLIVDSGQRDGLKQYLVFCSVPEPSDKAIIVFQSTSGVQKAAPGKPTLLPSGVAMYAFSSPSDIRVNVPDLPVAGELYHVLKVQTEGEIPVETIALLKSQLAEAQAQLAARSDASTAGNQRTGSGRSDRALKSLEVKISELEASIAYPCKSLVAKETLAAASLDSLEKLLPSKEPSLLATSALTLRALRHEGKWVTLKELMDSIPLIIENVELKLVGGSDFVDLQCSFTPGPGVSDRGLSMLAATTFELESIGTGAVAERLAQVDPISFHDGSNSQSVARRNVRWGGQKSTLWLRIIKNDDPSNPLVEEAIQIEAGDSSCVFKWAKEPSGKILIPAPEPDTPPGVVQERKVLDAKGPIRDLVAAGDGSTLLVQTQLPPYWSQLDLKSGEWITPTWKADKDTLIAAQADKLYLVNRLTKVVDVRKLATGERLGMQLLPIQGDLVSVAAPLSSPDRPWLAVTDKNAYLIDPEKFEIFRGRLAIETPYALKDQPDRDFKPMAASSIVARVSDDGWLYGISGFPSERNGANPVKHVVVIDRMGLIASRHSGEGWFGTKGRKISREVPDHGGGGDYRLETEANRMFPGPLGSISLARNSGRGSPVAVLKDPPAIPLSAERFGDGPVMDRRVYFDSVAGLLLFPVADKLHILRLQIPASAAVLPAFCYPGEVIDIPLPAGSGHRVECSVGGAIAVEGGKARWVVPASTNGSYSVVTIRRDWNGELGSSIGDSHETRILGADSGPKIRVPAGGSRSLNLRTNLEMRLGEFEGMAGSGHVALFRDSDECRAVHLGTGEVIFHQSSRNVSEFIGDADQLYLLERNGTLSSYDLNTGKKRAEGMLGANIRDLATGMASTHPLVAVEMDKARPFLSFIRRDTLRPVLTSFPEDTQRRFFAADFKVNASGSVAWADRTAILRDDKVVTVKPYENSFSGKPDASGRFIVESRRITDLGSNPPRTVEISSIPGTDDHSTCLFDESGRYVCITSRPSSGNGDNMVGSFRDLRDISKELFSITLPSSGNNVHFVSGTNSLVLQMGRSDGSILAVFDLDIPALAAEVRP